MKQIEDNFYISGHLDVNGLEKARCMGVDMVINNRPDHEDENQITSEELRQHALRLGMKYHWVPVHPGVVGFDDLMAFRDAVKKSEGAVVAFCRSGGRSAFMWTLLAACEQKLMAEDVVNSASKAGFDYSSLHGVLEMARMVGCKETASLI